MTFSPLIYSSSIVVDDKLVHLGYHKFGSELLVVAVPGSQVPVFQLTCIVNNIVRLLCFMYKTLDRYVGICLSIFLVNQ